MASPLSSLKVIDFSTLLPGPYATLMLADMGADVLRIESPTRPDMVRALPPKDDTGESAAHSYLNRNKKALALDLKRPQAKDIIHRLIADYDILVEQFRPGVMARLGLDYETLKQINPKLIYCSITGYGQTGPLKDRAGHDINYLALAGIADYSRRQGEAPVPQAVQIADVAGGSHHAVMGILAAVIERAGTGLGQHLDISMTDCAFSLNALFASGYLGGGIEPQAEETMLNGGSFYDYFETSDGRYLSVGSLEPQFLMALCSALQLESLAANALSPNRTMSAEFKTALAAAIKAQDFDHWCKLFSKLDCCVEPVLTFAEACEQPHAKARLWINESPQGIKQLNHPFFKDTQIQTTGTKLGTDTQAVLTKLGLSSSEIDELRAAKTIR